MSDPLNPKDAIGSRKPPLSYLPYTALQYVNLVLEAGARKYGRNNWTAAPIRASVYMDAAMRHLWAWWNGEDYDPETGYPHMAHVMACAALVLDANVRGKLVCDRPPPVTALDFERLVRHLTAARELTLQAVPRNDNVSDFTEQGEVPRKPRK